MTTAPMPTAPIGAACPSWPITAVSTSAEERDRRVRQDDGQRDAQDPAVGDGPGGCAHGASRHQEMARGLGEGPGAVVLPGLDVDAGVAPARARDPRPRVGVARQAGAQVVHREVDGLGQARRRLAARGVPASIASQHLRPGELDDRRHLEERAPWRRHGAPAGPGCRSARRGTAAGRSARRRAGRSGGRGSARRGSPRPAARAPRRAAP